MMQWLVSLFSDPNTTWIVIGCFLLGVSSGIVGTFTFLRKQSLMGDMLAHASLPGVCIAFMLTETKLSGLFFLGALASGIVATLSVFLIIRYTRIKPDAAIGIALSVFFGIGVVMLTRIQHGLSGNQSGLDKFLFGQAASMVMTDIYVMGGVAVLMMLTSFALFKELKLVTFDPDFSRGIGLPVGLLHQLILLLTLVNVIIGIQAVGVVLVAALLVIPAASARYWTNSLTVMIILSGAIGGFSGVAGTLISTSFSNLPTGPVIVLLATMFFVIGALASPQKGFFARLLRSSRTRLRYRTSQRKTMSDQIYERVGN